MSGGPTVECDSDIRKGLRANVVLSGAMAMFQRVGERMTITVDRVGTCHREDQGCCYTRVEVSSVKWYICLLVSLYFPATEEVEWRNPFRRFFGTSPLILCPNHFVVACFRLLLTDTQFFCGSHFRCKDVLLTNASDDTHCHRHSFPPRSSLSVQLIFFCHCGARTPFTTHGKAIFLCSCGLAPFTIAFNHSGNSLQFFAHPNLSSSGCTSLKFRFFPSIETAASHRTCELSYACPYAIHFRVCRLWDLAPVMRSCSYQLHSSLAACCVSFSRFLSTCVPAKYPRFQNICYDRCPRSHFDKFLTNGFHLLHFSCSASFSYFPSAVCASTLFREEPEGCILHTFFLSSTTCLCTGPFSNTP